MLTTLERLAKARELRLTVADLDAKPAPDRRLLLSKKADGLRDVLLGRKQNAIEDLDLFDPDGSAKVIETYWSGVKAGGLPMHDKAVAAQYLSLVTHHLQTVKGKLTGGAIDLNDPLYKMHGDLRTLAAIESSSHPFQLETLKRLSDAGQAVYAVRDEALSAKEAVKAVQDQYETTYAEAEKVYRAGIKSRQEALEPYRLKVKAIENQLRDLQQAEYNALYPKYREAHREMVAKHEELYEGFKFPDINDAFRPQREAAEAELAKSGEALIKKALEASPISAEAAEKWAEAQEITPSARANLKRAKYPVEQVRKDMAEFYRLSGGRLASLYIRTSGKRRASAEGIHGHSSSIINLGQNFNKRVLFHEMAHHLEADPMALAAGFGFLVKKRESRDQHSLRKLTNNPGYRSNEVAFKDHFIDPYVGKVYSNCTEVFSMGMESFSSPLMLAQRLIVDPEHFALMMGFVSTPAHPLYGSVKKVFAQAAAAEAELDEVREDETAEAIARLAAGVEFVKTEPPPDPPWMLGRWQGTYIGSYRGVDAYDCKAIKDQSTKRSKRGIALVLWEDRPGYGTKSLTWQFYFQGQDQAKAAARVAARSGRLELMTVRTSMAQLVEQFAGEGVS